MVNINRILFVSFILLLVGCNSSKTPHNSKQDSLEIQWIDQSSLWTLVEPTNIDFQFRRNLEKPSYYQLYRLDTSALRKVLSNIPFEGDTFSTVARDTLFLPIMDKSLVGFNLRNSPVMAPELAAKFPEIQSFTGAGVISKSWHLKCEHTPRGFSAQITTPSHTFFIEPVTGIEMPVYIVFNKKDMVQPFDKKFEEPPER